MTLFASVAIAWRFYHYRLSFRCDHAYGIRRGEHGGGENRIREAANFKSSPILCLGLIKAPSTAASFTRFVAMHLAMATARRSSAASNYCQKAGFPSIVLTYDMMKTPLTTRKCFRMALGNANTIEGGTTGRPTWRRSAMSHR